jgi:hypothetical protein
VRANCTPGICAGAPRKGRSYRDAHESGIDTYPPLAYSIDVMIFKETSVFTRQISKLIPDDAYREFQ